MNTAERIVELERQLVEYRTRHEVACSTLEIVKEQRTAAQKALAEQCQETKRLERQNEGLRKVLREVIDCISETRGKDATDAVANASALLANSPTAAGAGGQDIKEMVNRFLGWELPETFAPDCFIRFDGERAEQHESWPIGTNLLTADQAKAMFEYCLRSTATSAAHQEGGEQ